MTKKPSRSKYTKMMGFAAIAQSIRALGHQGATPAMVRDTYLAMKRGDKEMPHGIIGIMAARQLLGAGDGFDTLPD